MEKLAILVLRRQKTRHNTPWRGILLSSLIIIAFLACTSLLSSRPVFAANSGDVVETTFFGNIQDDNNGCGVYIVLNLVVDILSVGAGILGIVGITIVGIQYLTAGGDEQKTVKAKRRMIEIVIGLVAYAVLYAALQWFLPGAKLNTNNTCATVSNEELAKIKSEEEANKTSEQKTTDKSSNKKSSSPLTATLANGKTITISPQIAKKYTAKKFASKINQGKVAPYPKVCTNCTWGERIAETAKYLAWPEGTSDNLLYYAKGGKATKPFQKALDVVDPNHTSSFWSLGADCGHFVGVVIRYSGYDPKSTLGCQGKEDFYDKNPDLWTEVKSYKNAKPGDVCIRPGCHTLIYLGNNKVAEAHHGEDGGGTAQFGQIAPGNCAPTEWGDFKIYRPKLDKK